MNKKVGIILASMITIGALAGCSSSSSGSGATGGNASAGDGASKSPGETTTVEFWQLDGTGAMDYYKKAIAEFEAKHPDIKIKMSNIPEDGFAEKLNAAFAAGNGPDMWDGWNSPDEFARGYIMPLDDLIERDGIDMNQYVQPAVALRDKGTDGHYYGMPRDMSNALVFYNKDLFDKYHVAYPTDNWTLDEFKSAAQQLTHPEDGVYGTDLFASDFNAVTGNPILWNMGGDAASDDGLTVKGYVDSPQMIKLFQFAQDMSKANYNAPSSVMQTAGDGGPFSAGKIGMSLGFLWNYNDISKAKFKTGAVGFPKDPGNSNNFAWTEVISWYMNSKTKHKDAAWEFMKYMSSYDAGMLALKDKFMWGPPMPKVWEDKGLDKDPLLGAFLQQGKLQTKAPVYDRSRTWNEVGSMFSQAYIDCVTPVDGKSYKDPAVVLPKVAEEMQKKIDELKAQQ